MAIDSVNLANSVKDVKTQNQKPAFGQSVPQKQESEDKTGLIVVGLAAAAAIAAGVMLARGKGNKAVESAKEAAETVANKSNKNVSEFIANDETTLVNYINKEQTNGLKISSNIENEVPQSFSSGKFTETEVVDQAASLPREMRIVKERVVEEKPLLLENKVSNEIASNSEKVAQETESVVETVGNKINDNVDEVVDGSLNKTSKVASQVVGEYPNPAVVSKLKALTGTAEENVEKIKDIFMEELGYPKDLISIKIVDMHSDGLFSTTKTFGSFDFADGSLMLNKSILSSLSLDQLSQTMRHELDHFDKAVKVCKSIGVDEYEKIFKNIDPERLKLHELSSGKAMTFNKAFFEKAIKSANIDDFESTEYVKAILRKTSQKIEDIPDTGLYSEWVSRLNYYDDPLEQSAYAIEKSLSKSLGEEFKTGYEEVLPVLRNVEDMLDEAVKSYPPEFKITKSFLFDKFLRNAITKTDDKLLELYNAVKKAPDNKQLKETYEKLLEEKLSTLTDFNKVPDVKYAQKMFEKMLGEGAITITEKEVAKLFYEKLIKLRENLIDQASRYKYTLDTSDMVKHLGEMIEFFTKAKIEIADIDSFVLDLHLGRLALGGKLTDDIASSIYSNSAFKKKFSTLKSKTTGAKLEETPENLKGYLFLLKKQVEQKLNSDLYGNAS